MLSPIAKRFLLIAPLAFSSALPTAASCLVEGHVGGAHRPSGKFDLLFHVLTKAGGREHISHTIQIPKVDVVDGAFQVSLATDLDIKPESGMSVQMLFRPFEGWEPFRPGEISRVAVTDR